MKDYDRVKNEDSFLDSMSLRQESAIKALYLRAIELPFSSSNLTQDLQKFIQNIVEFSIDFTIIVESI